MRKRKLRWLAGLLSMVLVLTDIMPIGFQVSASEIGQEDSGVNIDDFSGESVDIGGEDVPLDDMENGELLEESDGIENGEEKSEEKPEENNKEGSEELDSEENVGSTDVEDADDGSIGDEIVDLEVGEEDNAFDETEETEDGEVADVDDALLLSAEERLALMASSSDIASGTSNNISWVIDEKGKLTVEGYGDFAETTPWYDNRLSIISAEVNITDMTYATSMFEGCSNLQSLDLSKFDTSKVTDMSYMFYWCNSLQSLDLSNFITRNVTDMSAMFEGCNNLQSLDLSKFDTSKVTGMSYMFYWCNSLQSLDLSNFITRNVTDMSAMFYECCNLQSLILKNFDTSKVTDMGHMFYRCSSLRNLDLSKFDTGNVTNMGGMFHGCSGLQSLDLSNFITRNVTNMVDMFTACSSLQNLNLSSFDTRNVIDMNCMFNGCSSLQSLDLSNFDNGDVTDMSSMFLECSNLQSLDLSNFGTRNVTDMSSMFDECSNLQSLNLSNFDTSKVTDMGAMFHGCSSLESLDLSKFDTSKVTDMGFMFYGCSSVQSLDLSKFDTRNVTDMSAMFYECGDLQSLNLSNFITRNVTDMSAIFYHCNSLNKIYTPCYVSVSVELWGGNWYRSDGTIVTELPQNLNYSILLRKNVKIGTFSFRTEYSKTGDYSYTYFYDESLFFNSSYGYQHDLVQMSMCVAMAAQGAKDIDGDNDESRDGDERTIRALMEDELEFDNLLFHYPESEFDSIGYAIGSKTIASKSGKECSLILVAIRGGGYGVEWGGNLRLGTGETHEGFELAKEEVVKAIEDYFENNVDKLLPECKIWITGFSRAAAVTNLVAKELDDGSLYGVSVEPEDVFAFCFECPQNTRSKDVSNPLYTNIINIINPADLVTKVAPREWGYSRYGTTLCLPYAEGSSNFVQSYLKMQQFYYKLIRENGNYESLSELETYDFPQTTIVDKFINNLASFISLGNNTGYQKYQDSFMRLAADYLGGGRSNDDSYSNFMNAALGIGTASAFAAAHPWNVGQFQGMIKKNVLFTAHYPELCYSWLNVLDGGLKSFAGSVYRIGYINCPVDVSVYDSSGSLVAQIINDTVQKVDGGLVVYIDDNGQKVIAMPSDEEYTVELLATDEGNVTYTVTEHNIDTGNTERVVSYVEVDVAKGDQLKGTVENLEEISEAEYPLILNDGSLAESDIDQTGDEVVYYYVTIEDSEGGTVYGNGRVLNGEYTKVGAIADDGYLFKGWYQGDALLSIDAEYRFLVTSDIALTARFVSRDSAYIVSFDANGGTVNFSTMVMEAGDTLSILPIAVRDGYIFTGWYKEASCENKWNFESDTVQGDIILYAGWQEYETLASPMASIEPGTVAKGTKVSLTCTVSGALIYYTLDGTEPTLQSMLFTEPIEIVSDTTVKAFAAKEGFNNSEVVSFIYVIDTESSDDPNNPDSPTDPTDQKNGIHIVGLEESYAYTGSKIIPGISVIDYDADGGKLLSLGVDYTVKYKNNTNVGTAEITVTSKGNYSGKETVTFDILPIDIGSEEVYAMDFYVKIGKKAQKPIPELYYMGTKLKNNKDFTITYSNATNIYAQTGEHSVTITGKGNYTGTRDLKLMAVEKIVKPKPVSMAKAVLNGFNKSFTYTGNACRQDCTLTVTTPEGNRTLVEGMDYTVQYANNIKAGTATVTYYGRNGYTGKLKKTYKILPYDILSDPNFKIKYEDNFECIYAKGGSKPKPIITFEGKAMKEGVDYTLSYKNNKAVFGNKTPCVTVKGKGCFKGKIPINFTIKAQELSIMTLMSGDKVYKNKANIYKITPKLMDLDGKQLSAGKDFDKKSITYVYENDVVLENDVSKKAGSEVEKTDIIPAGTQIRITLSCGSSGNYTGTFTGTYRITKADIKSAKVTIPKQIYTGNEITLDKSQITVKLSGVTLKPEDYEIIRYTDNVKKGKASVTIKGNNNYGGEKTVKFTIGAKGFLWWWKK